MLCGTWFSRDEQPPAITDYYRDTIRVIGGGTWSFVSIYRARTEPDEYAVKIRLKKNMPVNQTWKYAEKHTWKFAREEKILRKLVGHPNIVSFIVSFTEQARHCQVFELLFGYDLYPSIIRKYGGSHCERNVIGYMCDILNGLRYCHEKKIIHRNVIPPNLFLCTSPAGGTVKLIGFSLALHAKHGAGLYAFVGTAGYRAPEITGQNEYCYPVDLFACGCILYNLLTGLHPFDSHTSEEPTYYLPAWQLISEPARDLVDKLLMYEDYSRITAAQALDHPFFRNAGRPGLNTPLTMAVDGLRGFTQQNMWETVASDRNAPYQQMSYVTKEERARR